MSAVLGAEYRDPVPRRILVFAYACEPGKGSEPGAGWTWARMLARMGDVCVVTRANNEDAIRGGVGGLPAGERAEFVYVDLPAWMRFWKRGERGVRLYYLLWQAAALRAARRLHRSRPFDAVWHVTLANAWMGSAGSLVGPRFVFGPVGGGIDLEWRFLPGLGARGIVFELGRALVRTCARYLNPLARLSWSRASLILVQNEQGRAWLPRRFRDKCVVFPNALLEGAERPRRGLPATAERRALFAGKLLPLKGVALAIAALDGAPGWRLIVCGDGPDRDRLAGVARSHGVADRVEWRGWVERAEVLRALRDEAEVFMFPSLHDESPAAVADAVGAGVPVLCTDTSGARVVAGGAAVVVPAPTPGAAVEGLAEALRARRWPAAEAVEARAAELQFDARVEALTALDPLGLHAVEAVG
ncbi:MAG TPA: glycosyltransferase [Actinomycetota bacterium]|nr:glycosyltransferase [Actinomycetota bacterium]